ncbi:MAG: hypothetical protein N2117_04180 [Anaerolineales bacterium]|nr:hypothetical protein [Anaerolineales bacterium]
MNTAIFVSFGGNVIRFSAEHPALLAPLAVHLRHCQSQTTASPLSAFHLTAISETWVQISENGSVLLPRLERESAWQILMQESLTRLNGACTLGPVFHAAAVQGEQGGVILCGPSGCGKSTLTAWLVLHGFCYLSDEVILYTGEGYISGFARSLVLKNGSTFIRNCLTENIQREGHQRFSDGSLWLAPLLLQSIAPCVQTLPRLLLFPQYQPDAPLRVRPLSSAESLFRLLQNLVNARNLAHNGLEAAARLAHQTKAYAVVYSDLNAITAWIRQTINKPIA